MKSVKSFRHVRIFFFGAVPACFLFVPILCGAAPLIIDHSCNDLTAVPHSAIEQAKETLHIAYGHTSHGSQLISGMGTNGTQLDAFLLNSSKYDTYSGLYVWHDGPLEGYLDLATTFNEDCLMQLVALFGK